MVKVIFWAIAAFAGAVLVGAVAFSAGRDVERGARAARNVSSIRWLTLVRGTYKDQRDDYRQMARELCYATDNCSYCPLRPAKHDHPCKLWRHDGWVTREDSEIESLERNFDFGEVTGDGRR